MKLLVAIASISVLAGIFHLINPTEPLLYNYMDGSIVFVGSILIDKFLGGDKKWQLKIWYMVQ